MAARGHLQPSVAIGDLNNRDDKPDLATANDHANTMSVLLGNGTGSFGPKTDFATGINHWGRTGNFGPRAGKRGDRSEVS